MPNKIKYRCVKKWQAQCVVSTKKLAASAKRNADRTGANFTSSFAPLDMLGNDKQNVKLEARVLMRL